MTTLHPIAIRVLSMPGWRLRVWLAVVMIMALTTLPLPVAGLALWFASLPYLAITETLARMLGEQHRVRRRLEADRDGHAAVLAERDARITALEADLVHARSAAATRPKIDDDPVYRQVGLHPRAPEWLVQAARRAYRAKLHPDRHVRHRKQAHDRYLQAEAAFEEIEALRR